MRGLVGKLEGVESSLMKALKDFQPKVLRGVKREGSDDIAAEKEPCIALRRAVTRENLVSQ